MPAWRPVPTAMSTMLTFSIFSVIFLSIGIVLYVMSDYITEKTLRYDEKCPADGSWCLLPKGASDTEKFKIEKQIEPPIYVYYQLDNFY